MDKQGIKRLSLVSLPCDEFKTESCQKNVARLVQGLSEAYPKLILGLSEAYPGLILSLS